MLEEDKKKTLADLKRKRGTIKAALTRAHTFVNNFDPIDQAVSLLKFRQEELPQINRMFDEIQCQTGTVPFPSYTDRFCPPSGNR